MLEDREELVNGKTDQKVAFYRLFSFADRVDIGLMMVGMVSGIANGLVLPLIVMVFGSLVNSFGTSPPSQVVHEVSKACLKFVYLAIGAGIASFLQVSCWMVTGERQATRIRGLYLETILRQDIAFFDTKTNKGEVIGEMSGNTILIQHAMGEKVGKFVQLVSTFIGGFVIAFTKGWLLSVIMLSCVPALVVAVASIRIIVMRTSSHEQLAYEGAGNVIEQTIGAIRIVASFTGEKLAIKMYNRKLQDAYVAAAQQGLASGIGVGTMLLIIFCSYGLAVWCGAKLIIEKGYNGGQVISVIMAIMTGGMSLGQASPCLNAFAAGQVATYKMFEIIKRKPQIDAYDTSGIVMENIRGEIELKDVYFRYPARPDVQIFLGFTLKVPCGTTAALVGKSGSGKSTVISLLQRFYDPNGGEVLVDGINLKKFQVRWIREKMGLVSQEPILFTTTIRENVTYGKENATDEEIMRAIELANAMNFIGKLPKGLDTMVGEHGTQLSGGQKQRIAIARAIVKNPKILLLDEATSALDAESERIVQDALGNIMSSRTTVVVAHRLTTIRNADIIAVIKDGKIVEHGTHAHLINDPEGAYNQLVCFQEGINKVADGQSRETYDPDMGIIMESSQSQRLSLDRSVARGSFGLSTPIDRLTEEEGDKAINKIETYQKKSREAYIWRLAYLNKPELHILLLGSVAASISGAVFPVFGVLLSAFLKMFYEPKSDLIQDSRFWALIYVGMGIAILIVVLLQNYLFGIAGGKLIQRIRSLSFEKVVHQEISWFDDPKNSSGAVGARLSTDASTLRSLVGDALAQIVQNIATVIAGLVISLTANWILALFILAVLPLVFFQGLFQKKFIDGFGEDAKEIYEDASQVANDAIGSIRTIASFCAEKRVMDKYKNKCEPAMKHGVRVGLVSGISLGFSLFAFYSSNGFCFYIGAHLVERGRATFGDVFKVFFALTISAIGVSQSTAFSPDNNKAKESAASIFATLDSKPKIDSSSSEGTTLETIYGDIEFKNISFKYPTRPDVLIFRDLCLSIPSGKTAALVGESGCGKSTMISLIERFYDPDSGHIFLDGVDIQKFKLGWYRQQMGLVSQEPILFNETIRENIIYGKQAEATEEEIVAATRAANAHNFISALPQGYETNVGKRGVQLSGGQKQRIAIARAIIKDPKILLLDEATSALDVEMEHVVQDALDRVMLNRTTVVVAHRLSTIRGADIIAVVKNGVVFEKGTHDVLLTISNGAYASLVALHSTSPSDKLLS